MTLNLNPVFTSAGLAAIEAAHGRGISLEITHVALGDGQSQSNDRVGVAIRDDNGIPLNAARTRTALYNEQLRVPLTAATSQANQVMMEGTVPPSATEEFFIREIGFFAENVLIAYWSDAETNLGYRGAAAAWNFQFALAWMDLPANAITVRFTNGAVSGVMERLQTHIDDTDTHRPLASQAEARVGTSNTKLMTPLRVKEAVDSRLATQADARTETNNAKLMTPLRVKEAVDSRLATQAEARTGTKNTQLMTPLRVKEATDARLATQAEARAGTNNTKLMTPLRVKEAADARLATGAEARAGTDRTKLMSPYRTKQAIENHQPSLATGDEARTGTNNTKLMTPLRAREAADYQSAPRFGLDSPNFQTITTPGDAAHYYPVRLSGRNEQSGFLGDLLIERETHAQENLYGRFNGALMFDARFYPYRLDRWPRGVAVRFYRETQPQQEANRTPQYIAKIDFPSVYAVIWLRGATTYRIWLSEGRAMLSNAQGRIGTETFAVLDKDHTPLLPQTTEGPDIASQDEARTGTDNTKLMTPLRTKEAADARLATGAEARTGTDRTRLMSPYRTKQAIENHSAPRLALDSPLFQTITTPGDAGHYYPVNLGSDMGDIFIEKEVHENSETYGRFNGSLIFDARLYPYRYGVWPRHIDIRFYKEAAYRHAENRTPQFVAKVEFEIQGVDAIIWLRGATTYRIWRPGETVSASNPQGRIGAKNYGVLDKDHTPLLPQTTEGPDIASQDEAHTGTNNTKLMTPLRVKEAADARLATGAEARAGTDRTRLMSPYRTKQAIENHSAPRLALDSLNFQTITTPGDAGHYYPVQLGLSLSFLGDILIEREVHANRDVYGQFNGGLLFDARCYPHNFGRWPERFDVRLYEETSYGSADDRTPQFIAKLAVDAGTSRSYAVIWLRGATTYRIWLSEGRAMLSNAQGRIGTETFAVLDKDHTPLLPQTTEGPDIASQDEARTGTNNTKLMTPLRVKEAADARLATGAEARAGTDRTKLMSPYRTKQAIENHQPPLATGAEARAGTDRTKLMSPLRVRQAIQNYKPGISTQAEARAGTNNTKMMTPLRVKEATEHFNSPRFAQTSPYIQTIKTPGDTEHYYPVQLGGGSFLGDVLIQRHQHMDARRTGGLLFDVRCYPYGWGAWPKRYDVRAYEELNYRNTESHTPQFIAKLQVDAGARQQKTVIWLRGATTYRVLLSNGTAALSNAQGRIGAEAFPVLDRNYAPLLPKALMPGKSIHRQFFSQSGTFTVPAGVTQIYVQVTGGGGGGGSDSHRYTRATNGGDSSFRSTGDSPRYNLLASGGPAGSAGGSGVSSPHGRASGGHLNIAGGGAPGGRPRAYHGNAALSTGTSGGNGGLVIRQLTVSPGDTFTVVIGAGGTGGSTARWGTSGYAIVEYQQ